MSTRACTSLAAITLSLIAVRLLAGPGDDAPVGYDDTPFLPDSEWRVHDKQRPVPPTIDPGDATHAPSDAIVLFDGSDLSAWVGAKSGAAKWQVVDGFMEVNGSGGIRTREEFGDCQLHLEWAAPAEVVGESQGRGNSGVFFMERYEVQILDSHQNRTYADGQAAALYGQKPPLVNACRPPGAWQTFDIVFRAPRFEDGELRQPAVMTVFHNGVLMHHAEPMIGGTAHRKVGVYVAHAPSAPIMLQDHGNPVRFRNIWVRRL